MFTKHGEASALMVDIPTFAAGSSLVPQSRAAPGRSEAVKTAQRAFFQAALNGVESAPATSSRVAPTVAVQPTCSDAPPPGRLLRPGSLLDIKV